MSWRGRELEGTVAEGRSDTPDTTTLFMTAGDAKGQLATGAAACFSGIAPPPETTPVEPTDDTPRKQIRIKRVPSEP